MPEEVIHTKMSNAVNKVFGTFELIENILSFVPDRDLLVSAQRVCKYWNTIIQTSIYVQQKLFYKQTKPSSKGIGEDPLRNLFLTEILRLGHTETKDTNWWRELWCLHELFCIYPSHPSKGYRKIPKNLTRKVQSWQTMYPSSKPVTVDVWRSEERWLEGKQTTLGSIMAVVDRNAAPGRTAIVKHRIMTKLHPCNVLIHDRMAKLRQTQEEVRWAVKAHALTVFRPVRRLERDPLWVS